MLKKKKPGVSMCSKKKKKKEKKNKTNEKEKKKNLDHIQKNMLSRR